jgi:ABC-type Fe3+ transport system permease subunit
MLYSPNSRVISLLMWDSWQSGDVNRAAATGVVLMFFTGVIIFARSLCRPTAHIFSGEDLTP